MTTPQNERAENVTTRLPESLLARIDRYAAEDGRTRSGAIRRLLEERLDQLDLTASFGREGVAK